MTIFKGVYRLLICTALLLTFSSKSQSQDSTSGLSKIISFPSRLLVKLDKKNQDLTQLLDKQMLKYLRRLERQEQQINRKISKTDSAYAKAMLEKVSGEYKIMKDRLKNNLSDAGVANYLPRMDTLKTALTFLTQQVASSEMLGNLDRAEKSLGQLSNLQSKFQDADEVKNFIIKRQEFLTGTISRYGLNKQLAKFKKEAYYYQAQVNEYTKLFQNASGLERKAIEFLQRSTEFRNFFSRNSQLATLFRLPNSDAPIDPDLVLAGLQTRKSTQELLRQKFGSDQIIDQAMQQRIDFGKLELSLVQNELRKVGQYGGNTEELDFKPNNQRTKRLADRLEFGTNLQTVKANRFFPSTTDIGLSIGYKVNDNSVIGLGSSYKMGWGTNFRHIKISHQGVGLRSFIDVKLKGKFWLSGGGELNYKSTFAKIEALNQYDSWQKSALVGISRKYSISKKIKGDAKLLYDFLSRQQVPASQPLVFRLGYSL